MNETATIETPDVGALRRGRNDVETAARALGKKAKDVFAAAFELEQLSFLNEPEFEEAVLFDGATLRKKYTGEQAEKIEWRRDVCVYLLSRETPQEDIAKLLKMNLRTVTAIAANNGRKLGAFTEDFANRLIASAASDIALADTKRSDASYKDLHVGAGIKMQHAVAVKLVAETGTLPAIDAEAADDKLAGLRDKIKRLKPAEENSAKNEQE